MQVDDLAHAAKVIAVRSGAQTGSSFVVLVPAAHTGGGWETESSDRAAVQARLAALVTDLAADGVANDEGVVGDADVLVAIDDALRGKAFDTIILASPPEHLATTFGVDLAERIERRFALPVVTTADLDAPRPGATICGFPGSRPRRCLPLLSSRPRS